MVSHATGPAPASVSSGQPAPPRVAFFGGSFDPPHLGPLAIACAARDALKLDRVLFAPVGAQPLKPHGSSAPFADRATMTHLAIAGEPAFELSLVDAPTESAPVAPNYTLEALERLRDQLPAGASLFCLIGADSYLTLRRWHRAAEIPFTAGLIVASRPGQSLHDLAAALPPGLTLTPNPAADASSPVELRAFTVSNAAGVSAPFYLLPGLQYEMSASQIRRALHSGSSTAAELIPSAVAQYISEHGLYR